LSLISGAYRLRQVIIKYPNIRRFPGGASTDLRPNLQDPSNPVPAMDPLKPPRIGGGGG
jgi:arylsulfatase